jgi:hypothetical protein
MDKLNPEKRIDKALVRDIQTLEERLTELRVRAGLEPANGIAIPRARGTGDVTAQAAQATRATAPAPTPAELVEQALRREPMTSQQIARATGLATARVSDAIRKVRPNLFNIGTETDPMWCWIIGDAASTDKLNAYVAQLITIRPMTFRELKAATGARDGRVSAAIVRLQQNKSANIVDLGTGGRARWFLMPTDVTIARIKSGYR